MSAIDVRAAPDQLFRIVSISFNMVALLLTHYRTYESRAGLGLAVHDYLRNIEELAAFRVCEPPRVFRRPFCVSQAAIA